MTDTFSGVVTSDGKKRVFLTDDTLTKAGVPADAKIVGDKFAESEKTVSQLNQDLDDKTSQLKKDIGDLSSSKITKFYASNLGETHITDSDDGKMADMKLYGRSEQKQYSGKNLLDINKYLGKTVRGAIIFDFSLKAGTYTLSCNIGGNVTEKGYSYDIKDANRSALIAGSTSANQTFNIDEEIIGKAKTFNLYPWSGSNGGVLLGLQLEKGSEATEIEPYTGGQPSPSPDYPQEIKSVVNPTVKVCGKNIMSPGLKLHDITKCYIKKGMKLTIIAKDGFTSNGGNIVFYNNNNNRMWLGFNKGAKKATAKLSDNAYAFEYALGDLESKNVCLVIGDNDTYVPYHEQTVTLPYTLNAIPVSSGGNVTIDGQQYIADYVDVERGKLVRMCKRQTANTKSGKADEEYRLSINAENSAKNGSKECIFSAFKWVSWETCANGDYIYIKNIKKSNNELYTAQELKELSLDFDAIYQLSEQQETDLTPEEIAAFKSLATYYPVTNISANSEQLDGLTVFNYPISMANGWNYVKQQLNDNRDYIYDMDTKTQDIDTQAAEAYVNSEYAVALTELEV